MGYERFSAELFSCPFLVVEAELSGHSRAVRFAIMRSFPMRAYRWSPSISPDRSPVSRPFDPEVAAAFWQENVGNFESRIVSEAVWTALSARRLRSNCR
jgi:hypothetical protein